jgi:hypothetical protein
LTTPLLHTIEYGGVPPVIKRFTTPSILVVVVGSVTSQTIPKGNKVIGSHSFLKEGLVVVVVVRLAVGVRKGVLVGVGVTLVVGVRVGVTLDVGVRVGVTDGVGVGLPQGIILIQLSQFRYCGNTNDPCTTPAMTSTKE